MPSCQLLSASGGIRLVSGDLYSGSPQLIGGVQLKLAKGAPGAVYVGLPALSGSAAVTATSGGSLSSGGLLDGMELNPAEAYFIPKVRLMSGIETIRVAVPAASSGGVLFWEVF